ncbi:MAG: TIGR03668 family PPOX class F420-dependent oxidoreductase [Vicinamibacterales bacterium]
MLSDAESAFVQGRRIAHLATADAGGQPHVVPVCFAYVEGRFYIAIDEKPKTTERLKRLRNIEVNTRVALVFDLYDEDWERLGWVMVRGTATVIEGGPEHDRAVSALRDRYEQYRSMALEGRPVIRVDPKFVTSWGSLD